MSGNSLPEFVVNAARHGADALRRAVDAAGGTPIYNADGTVTLLYAGVADEVLLRHWLDIFPQVPPFRPIVGDSTWSVTFPFPEQARIEYKLSVGRHGRHRLKADQMNPLRAGNPWGANSELRGIGYLPPRWALPNPAAAKGIVTRHEIESKVFGNERAVHIYHPPGLGGARHLLVVHDGDDYLNFAALGKVLDNLIAAGDIPPVAALLTDPGDRMGEYRGSDQHAAYLVEEVVPMALAETGATLPVAMGASLGGVASLHAATCYPGVFVGLILQAGSFVRALGPFGRGQVFAPVVRFMTRFHSGDTELPGRIHVSCGRYDGLVNEARHIAEELSHRGVEVGYADVAAGHDWHAWRDLLRPALMHTLPTR